MGYWEDYWAEIKGAWGGFSKVMGEEIKYQAKNAGKTVVQASKHAATAVWDNREAIAKTVIAAGADMVEEARRRQEETQRLARQHPMYQHLKEQTPHPHQQQSQNYTGPDDYDEPTHVMDWQQLPNGLASDLSEYRDKVGLYRLRNQAGEVVYVGRAIEYDNGGLRKRLRDYTRDSDTGRKHASGQQIYANREDLTVEVLVVGNDAAAAALVKQIEPDAIREDNPLWNKHHTKPK